MATTERFFSSLSIVFQNSRIAARKPTQSTCGFQFVSWERFSTSDWTVHLTIPCEQALCEQALFWGLVHELRGEATFRLLSRLCRSCARPQKRARSQAHLTSVGKLIMVSQAFKITRPQRMIDSETGRVM